MDDVLPDAVHRFQITSVACDGGHVGDGAVEVHRPHGVADDFGLVADGAVVLVVFAPDRFRRLRNWLAAGVVTAYFEEELGELEITLLAGDAPELDQG